MLLIFCSVIVNNSLRDVHFTPTFLHFFFHLLADIRNWKEVIRFPYIFPVQCEKLLFQWYTVNLVIWNSRMSLYNFTLSLRLNTDNRLPSLRLLLRPLCILNLILYRDPHTLRTMALIILRLGFTDEYSLFPWLWRVYCILYSVFRWWRL